jgi:hypothetical protein
LDGFGEIVNEAGAEAPRSSRRDSMLLQATLVLEACGETIVVRVRNISAGGLMAEGTLPASCGEQARISLRGVGEVPGVVAWVRNGRFGITFDAPIDPAATRKKLAVPATRRQSEATGRRPGLRTD